MIIKSKQIADSLGISQATVSLAINNKPGVSEKTRERILTYIAELNQKDIGAISINKSIQVLSYMRERGEYDKENAEFHSTILREISKDAKLLGFNLKLSYIHSENEAIEVVENSKIDGTSGIIILAADMCEEDFEPFISLDIPVVVCDYAFDDMLFDSVCNDNTHGVWAAMDHLVDKGHKDIVYFYNTEIIYNFKKRREALDNYIIKKKLGLRNDYMIEVGTKVNEIYATVEDYIKKEINLPTAIFTENYAISIATIKVLQENGYKIGEDISIIGFDSLPSYVLTDFKFTHIQVLFINKAELAIKRLIKNILEMQKETTRITIKNKLIVGDSVKNL